ncbi:MAG: YceI family protein [Ketobacter sp.]|nr:YceI family protein [Ketobacter sp.]RLU00458.1 MAG: YceI family protein [Ketobacter sp.]
MGYAFSMAVIGAALLTSGLVQAADTYKMDTKGSHAFIQFKIQHLGFSWLLGRFNTFEGEFVLDEANVEKSSVKVDIDVASVDSNHAERDKHLRGKDFFDVAKFPKAGFVSTKIEKTGDNTAKITGDFTLKGITKPITLDATYIGGGKDPWGGYRQGFEATTQLKLKDFGIDYNLGPASEVVNIYISVEGIKQ